MHDLLPHTQVIKTARFNDLHKRLTNITQQQKLSTGKFRLNIFHVINDKEKISHECILIPLTINFIVCNSSHSSRPSDTVLDRHLGSKPKYKEVSLPFTFIIAMHRLRIL